MLCILKKYICPAFFSKIISSYEKQMVFLTILNEEEKGWYYIAVKKLSALLRGITLKNNGDFYCLNCIHSFRKENQFKSYVKNM